MELFVFTIASKHLKLCTFSISISPISVVSIVGSVVGFLEHSIHFILLALITKLTFSSSVFDLLHVSGSACCVLACISISLAYAHVCFSLVDILPHISSEFNTCSITSLNNSAYKGFTCSTPDLIAKLADSSLLILTSALVF
jgi:hypothetical protein